MMRLHWLAIHIESFSGAYKRANANVVQKITIESAQVYLIDARVENGAAKINRLGARL
jgi:hypothetical protein